MQVSQKGWATIDKDTKVITDVTFGSKPVISQAYRSFMKVKRCKVVLIGKKRKKSVRYQYKPNANDNLCNTDGSSCSRWG
jgi:hypothetical protein